LPAGVDRAGPFRPRKVAGPIAVLAECVHKCCNAIKPLDPEIQGISHEQIVIQIDPHVGRKIHLPGFAAALPERVFQVAETIKLENSLLARIRNKQTLHAAAPTYAEIFRDSSPPDPLSI
jgi:hypothetical protein